MKKNFSDFIFYIYDLNVEKKYISFLNENPNTIQFTCERSLLKIFLKSLEIEIFSNNHSETFLIKIVPLNYNYSDFYIYSKNKLIFSICVENKKLDLIDIRFVKKFKVFINFILEFDNNFNIIFNENLKNYNILSSKLGNKYNEF